MKRIISLAFLIALAAILVFNLPVGADFGNYDSYDDWGGSSWNDWDDSSWDDWDDSSWDDWDDSSWDDWGDYDDYDDDDWDDYDNYGGYNNAPDISRGNDYGGSSGSDFLTGLVSGAAIVSLINKGGIGAVIGIAALIYIIVKKK